MIQFSANAAAPSIELRTLPGKLCCHEVLTSVDDSGKVLLKVEKLLGALALLLQSVAVSALFPLLLSVSYGHLTETGDEADFKLLQVRGLATGCSGVRGESLPLTAQRAEMAQV